MKTNHRDCYLGPSACILSSSCSTRILPSEVSFHPQTEASTLLAASYRDLQIPVEMHNFLVHNYMSNAAAMYPILEDSEPCLQMIPGSRMPSLERDQFLQSIIYSISCHCVPPNHQGHLFLPLADSFHQRAIEHIEAATSELSIQSLRNIALLAFHSLLSPSRGNCYQLIGLATRLCIDLGLEKETDTSMRRLYLAVLCMERQVALTFDRPWFLHFPVRSTLQSHCDYSLKLL